MCLQTIKYIQLNILLKNTFLLCHTTTITANEGYCMKGLFYFFLSVFLSAALHAEVTFDEKGLPEGSWRQSCQNARYDKNTKRLTADCKTSYEHFTKATDTNKYTTSSLYLDETKDIKDIQNHNGWLVAVLHQGGNYVLPEGSYKKECAQCEILLTNDEIGNKVFCLRCLCTTKDEKGNLVKERRTLCHPDLLKHNDAIQMQNGIPTLNPKYLPGGNYLQSCKLCRIELGFKRSDAKAENGLQLSCICPSTTANKNYNTHVRITDMREFVENPKTYSNTAGILTED